jgi:hypothetical protein
MRIVFSRKGFDSKFGGGASPIVDGRPVSLPIPASNGEQASYAQRGLAELVATASRGKLAGDSKCHDDPMFAQGHCWLGQVGAAQGHLRNQCVGPGDMFLFFGLYVEPDSGERHHRLFGWMRVADSGAPHEIAQTPGWREPPRPHPHFSGQWRGENAIWFGKGAMSASASPTLRLTAAGERGWARWRMPEWLAHFRPSYLGGDWRWSEPGLLDARGIWQETVCDIGEAEEPRRWLELILTEMAG